MAKNILPDVPGQQAEFRVDSESGLGQSGAVKTMERLISDTIFKDRELDELLSLSLKSVSTPEGLKSRLLEIPDSIPD